MMRQELQASHTWEKSSYFTFRPICLSLFLKTREYLHFLWPKIISGVESSPEIGFAIQQSTPDPVSHAHGLDGAFFPVLSVCIFL